MITKLNVFFSQTKLLYYVLKRDNKNLTCEMCGKKLYNNSLTPFTFVTSIKSHSIIQEVFCMSCASSHKIRSKIGTFKKVVFLDKKIRNSIPFIPENILVQQASIDRATTYIGGVPLTDEELEDEPIENKKHLISANPNRNKQISDEEFENNKLLLDKRIRELDTAPLNENLFDTIVSAQPIDDKEKIEHKKKKELK